MNNKQLYSLNFKCFLALVILPIIAPANASQPKAKIDLNHIYGQWACTEQLNYFGYVALSQSEVEFKADGHYSEKSKIVLSKSETVANYQYSAVAQWKLDNTYLIIDQNKLLDFTHDQPKVEEQLNLKEALASPDEVIVNIKKLTKNEMILNLMLYEIELPGVTKQCQR